MWKNVKVYKDNGSKFDGGGRFDWETRQGYNFDEKFQFGYHGPKSAFLVSRFLWLSEEEFISISCHMGAFDRLPNDYSLKNAYESFPLAFMLHISDYSATILDEKEPKGTQNR